MCVERHLALGADVTTNVEPRSFPRGLDVQVVTRAALHRLDEEATSAYDREHVLTHATPARGYRVHSVSAPPGLYGPDVNLCIDTAEDYERLKEWVG